MKLTIEQHHVIQHPLGKHARVLAVAGSGKSTTLAYRAKYLIEQHHVKPHHIVVIMFNRLARQQFKDRVHQIARSKHRIPSIHTFHSLAFMILQDAVRHQVIMPFREKWFELPHLPLLVINRILSQIDLEDLDPEEILYQIQRWKESLITPDHVNDPEQETMRLIYHLFEEERHRRHAIAFADFVPTALRVLQENPTMQRFWLKRFEFLIVDEYQDINLCQQALIELLAYPQADVMIVGDDDQTIYEWRGAQSDYIVRHFKSRMSFKLTLDYTLTYSFRLDAILAQAAENCIRHNRLRVDKPILAYQYKADAKITIFDHNANQQLADYVLDYTQCVKTTDQMIILGRTYRQLHSLELQFLERRIPYRVDGGDDLFSRKEIRKLIHYCELAFALDDISTQEAHVWLLATANTPNRMLKKDMLTTLMHEAMNTRVTVRFALTLLQDPDLFSTTYRQRQRIAAYVDVLNHLNESAHLPADTLLKWLVDTINYLGHFEAYYGATSDTVEDHKHAIQSLLEYASSKKYSLGDFVNHLRRLDTTYGKPKHEQVVMTSIHRAKGLEYEIVILPNCTEKYMPCKGTFDPFSELNSSSTINFDDERRLFYVALTRAKSQVYIGTSPVPESQSRFIHEMNLPQTEEVIAWLKQADFQALQQSLPKWQHLTWLVANMIAVYLPRMKQKEADDLVQIMKKTHPNPPLKPVEASQSATAQSHQHYQPYPRTHEAWTDEEETQMKHLYEQGLQIAELAVQLQRKPSVVRNKLNQLRGIRDNITLL